jgi:hypothetical protein
MKHIRKFNEDIDMESEMELEYPFVIFNQSNESKSIQDKLINELDMSWSFSSGRPSKSIQPDNITYIYSNWNFDGDLILEDSNINNNPDDEVWDRTWSDDKGNKVFWSKYIWDGMNIEKIN